MEIFKTTNLSIHVSQLAIHKSTPQLQLAINPFLGVKSWLTLCGSLFPTKAISNKKKKKSAFHPSWGRCVLLCHHQNLINTETTAQPLFLSYMCVCMWVEVVILHKVKMSTSKCLDVMKRTGVHSTCPF